MYVFIQAFYYESYKMKWYINVKFLVSVVCTNELFSLIHICRQQLIRHGKKGKMKLFLDEAPQETMFIQEAVELTTKVGDSLNRLNHTE